MAGDKVSEVYKRHLQSEKSQVRLRRRIEWIINQVEGPSVLDIGCSQGIISILLARKGFRVLGLDPDIEAIDYALADLAEEPENVRERVEFRVSDALTMAPEPDLFDTVVLGEVIEHLSRPERLVEVAFDALKPGGTAVITTPFGVLEHPDHYETYYLSNFLDLVRPYFEMVEVDIIGKRICFTGRRLAQKGTRKSLRSRELEHVIELSERHFRAIEDDYLSEIDRTRTNWRIYQERLAQEQKSNATLSGASVETLNKWHEQSQQENDKRFGELLETFREERTRSDDAAKRALFMLMAMEQSRATTESELRDKIKDAVTLRRRLNDMQASLEDANERITALEKEREALEAQRGAGETARKELERSIAAAEAEKAILEADRMELREANASAAANIEQLREEIARQTRMIEEREAETEREVGALEAKLADAETRLQTLDDGLAGAAAERDRLADELHEASARSDSVERHALVAETRASVLERRLHDIELAMAAIETAFAPWSDELGKAEHVEPPGLTPVAMGHQGAFDGRLDMLLRLATDYAALRSELSRLRSAGIDESQHLRAEIERLTFENEVLAKRVQVKAKKIRRLGRFPQKFSTAQTEIDRLYGSVRFQLGSILVEAMRPSRATLLMPLRLAKLAGRVPSAIARRRQARLDNEGIARSKRAQLLDEVSRIYRKRGAEAAEKFIAKNEIGPEEFNGKLWNRLSTLCEPTDPVQALKYARRSLHRYKWPDLARKVARLSRQQGYLHLPQKMMRYHLLEKEHPPTEQEILYQRMVTGWVNLLDKDVPVPPPSSIPMSPIEGRALLFLHNSLPHASGGYAIRSHGLLQGLAQTSYQVRCFTRLGFPWDLSANRYQEVLPYFPEQDSIDGIVYNRIPAFEIGHGQIPIDQYLSNYAERIRDAAVEWSASLIHTASNFNNGVAGLAAARALDLPFVYEVRGLWEITRVSRDPTWAENEYYQACVRMETEAARGADHVITITGALAEELVNRGVDPERITVVPNGADPQRFVPRDRDMDLAAELGVVGKTVIGFIGSFTQYEGLDDLLRVAKRLSEYRDDFKMLLVGDGNEFDRLSALRTELGVEDTVILTGRVPFEQVEKYYSLIDIAPFPRKPLPVCEMVSPLKPYEAMAMERAVLVSSVAALAEMVRDGETGLIFEKGNLDDLTDKIRYFIDNPSIRQTMGRRARQWVIENRTWRHSAEAVARIYEKLEASAGRRRKLDDALPPHSDARALPAEHLATLDQLLAAEPSEAAMDFVRDLDGVDPQQRAALWEHLALHLRLRDAAGSLQALTVACELEPTLARVSQIVLLSREVGAFDLPQHLKSLMRANYARLLADPELRPADPETAYREGGVEAAQEVMAGRLTGNASHDASLWASMGTVAEKAGSADDALAFSLRAIELFPSWPGIRQVARTLRTLGYLDLPERIMRYFIRIKPNYTTSERNYLASVGGWARLYREGFPVPARNEFSGHAPERLRIAYCLHNSLPYASAGYATRAQGILEGLRRNSTDVVAVTRHGFPNDLAKYKNGDAGQIIPQFDDVNGVTYHRLLSDGTGNGEVPIDKFLDIYAGRLEVFCREHGVSVLHAASNFYNGIAGLVAARRLGIPFLYEVRGLWELTRISRDPAWAWSEYHQACVRMETIAAREADAVVTITPALKDELIRRGVAGDRISVIPNAVNPERFKPREYDQTLGDELGLTGHCVIGFVGSFVQYEGLDDMLRVAARLHREGVDFRLLLVGDGAIHQEIVELVDALDLQSITVITGRVPFEEVDRYYSLIDIAPFPRKPLPVCELVSPLKPFEAMAMEKAVVVSSVRALVESVVPGHTALVFEKGSDDSFHGVLKQLIESSETRARLGRAAREWVLSSRTWDGAANAFAEIYRSLHEKRTGHRQENEGRKEAPGFIPPRLFAGQGVSDAAE